MRDMPILRLSVLVLIVGFAVGGWRSWHSPHTDHLLPGDNLTRIELLTTADKANWVRSQVFTFNEINYKKYQVTVHYVDSRAAMEKVLDGSEQPVLWSPESPTWIARANDVWQQRKGGPLVQVDDYTSYRVFLRSPLVFLTTHEKAGYLRRYLSGSRPWASLHDMSSGDLRPPWGRLRFSISDPLRSNSGMASLGMILVEYTRDHGGSLTGVASTPQFGAYLAKLNRGLVFDEPCRQGTAALAAAYVRDVESRDVIVTYENIALSAARWNKTLEVIYPNPTETADLSVCIVNGSWVTPQQRVGAQAFMAYISRPESLQLGLRYNMRPAVPESATTMETRLAHYQSQGFQQTYTTVEPPPYDALNIAAGQWNRLALGRVRN